MTGRHAAYTVVLREDVSGEDAEAVMTALRMISGVISVQPVEADWIGGTITRLRRDREWSEAVRRLADAGPG